MCQSLLGQRPVILHALLAQMATIVLLCAPALGVVGCERVQSPPARAPAAPAAETVSRAPEHARGEDVHTAAQAPGASGAQSVTNEPETVPASPSRDATSSPAVPDAPPCAPRRTLLSVDPDDRPYAGHFVVRDEHVALLISQDFHAHSEVLSAAGRFADVEAHTGAQLLADGRVLFLRRRGKSASVVVDGTAGPSFDDVWYPSMSPDGAHFAYAASKDGRWRAFVDHQPVGGEHDQVDYPFANDAGSLFAITRDGEQSAVVRDTQPLAVFPEITGGPWFDEAGEHVLVVAERGRRDLLAVRDDVVLEGGCRSAVGYGFAPKSAAAVWACEREQDAWWLTVEGGGQWGPFVNRPWILFEAGTRALGPHAPAVVIAGGEVEYGGERVVTGARRVAGAAFSPDGERVALLVERDGEMHLELHAQGASPGDATRWTTTHPALAPDVLLGKDWAMFSADGRHVGTTVGGSVVVDDTQVAERGQLWGLTAAGVPLLHVSGELKLGGHALAAAETVFAAHLDAGHVRFVAWDGAEVFAGCAPLP